MQYNHTYKPAYHFSSMLRLKILNKSITTVNPSPGWPNPHSPLLPQPNRKVFNFKSFTTIQKIVDHRPIFKPTINQFIHDQIKKYSF